MTGKHGRVVEHGLLFEPGNVRGVATVRLEGWDADCLSSSATAARLRAKPLPPGAVALRFEADLGMLLPAWTTRLALIGAHRSNLAMIGLTRDSGTPVR